MDEVYVWKVGDKAIHHTDLQAAADLDGLTRKPDVTTTAAEFAEAGGLVRIIGGKIFFGKTQAEKTAEENQKRVVFLKRQLAETDYIAAKIAEGSATQEEYAEKIAQRRAWRSEINSLENP